MNIEARATIEDLENNLDRVLLGFTANELVVKPLIEPSSEKELVLEIRAKMGKTLMEFCELCVEQGIVLSIERISSRDENPQHN